MKQVAFTILFICSVTLAFAQIDSSAKYWKDRNLPHFSMLRPDSSLFTDTCLQKGKATIIMLFNPECEHCQEQFKMLANLKGIAANCQVILSSTETMEKIRIFSNKFNVGKYPFVHLVKDNKFIFGPFFQPKTVPVLIYYDAQGQFQDIRQGEVDKEVIKKWLRS